MTIKQLPLSVSLRDMLRAEGDKLLETARDTIHYEMKQADDFAALVGVKPSQLSAALNDNGYNFALRWVPAVLHIDRRRRLLTAQARLSGCRVVEDDMTDAEKVRRYEAAFRRNGPAGEAIRRDALDGEEA